MALQTGTLVGHYKVLSSLGAGGMGEVYRAHDPKLDREVALKVLPKAFTSDSDRLGRFEREAKVLASLNHPNIGQIYGLEDAGGVPALVLELVEGPTLAKRLAAGPLALKEALAIAKQVAAALETAHEQGIVHRDLKPANVKVRADGTVKVLDFGLALPMRSPAGPAGSNLPTEKVQPTRTGTLMGTVPYMSPEQARGQKVDPRTDIWALGCVLYECLSGRQPFQRESTADTIAAILGSEPDWARLPAETPASIERLLQRMLSKDHERRLRHVGDARLELQEALEELTPTPAEPVSGSGEETGRRDGGRVGGGATRGASAAPIQDVRSGSTIVPGRRAGVRTTLAVLTTLVLVGLAGAWYLRRATPAPTVTDRSIAVLPFESLGREEATAFTVGVHGDMLTRLSSISDLRVISRTSVMQFRKPQMTLPEIARQLNVTWVLLGEVEEAGGRVKLNARLIIASEDRQVWAESYQRQLTAENLFDIQGELTRQIAEQLQAHLSPEEERAVGRSPTENLDAYRLYATGRTHLEQRTEEEMRRAVESFQAAIDQDPKYALAWAGLADSLNLLAWYGHSLPENAPDPERAARRALELEPDLAEARTSLGIFLSTSARPDGPAALREFERAIELRPTYADPYPWLAWLQLELGRPEKALDPAERAVRLDPLAPYVRVFTAESYLANGRPEQALEDALRATEIQPGYALAHYMKGLILYHLGRLSDADAALHEALASAPPHGESPTHSQIQALRGLVRASSGDPAGARSVLAELDDADPFSIGLVHAALGEEDLAFAAFERVRDWGQLSTEHIRYFFPQVLGPLRQDPRFEAVRRAVDRSWGL